MICKRIIIWLLLCLIAGPALKAQEPGQGEFAVYAGQQQKLFVQLYEQRDVNRYHRVLDSFITRYASQPDVSRRAYKQHLANGHYNLSCAYALLGQKKPALDQLEQAIRAGYVNYSHMMKDADLDVLRKEPRFAQLLQPLRATGDYLYILRRGAAYDLHDQRPLPAFTFQPASDSQLVALRKGFRLDSIAGAGSDVSKVLNLLHWVHELIPHDGNHENPPVKNAMDLIGVCRKEGRGLNCRGLATVLNECYLSMGFASRLVTCLPKDSLGVDPDCHVINVVWVPSLQKWVWTDPTQDAYVMNEQGVLLGIDEVRERLIAGRPLILNPTANWNHRVSATKEQYLYQYMAKNLYMLQCPVNSAYDMERPAAGKTIQYIQLMPLDYFKQKPDSRSNTKAPSGTTYQFYNTNNPALFWQKPL
ncbi:transglutaminase domain-containing protein [Paraflavitalea sp. CAU 1676]|uniref:transglutaminase-like domain-containing protein n=1 Tax=Paraflavitalea sp. CAU 1676 TaxID=3032598 RepID=UPI0023DCA0D7|nr:transglutaminase domain-containing protein [Paraflavitalea sp. CAU 1676]MDF2188857.1 transglutaminase domain-containing protein [Paraflavitalea sp. CAU 1676]